MMPSGWILSGFCDEATPDFAGQIDVANRAGLTHLDVRMVGSINIADLPVEDAAPLASMVEASGLKVGCLGSGIGKIDIADDTDIDLARLDRLAGHAQTFGTSLVRVFSYFNKAEQDRNVWRQESLHRLGLLKERAKELGLCLLLENERHIYGDRLQDMLDLIEPLGEAGVFEMIFDFDNYNQSGDDCWTNWKTLKPWVTSFHLKDSTSECVHVPIGEGAGKAREILTDALKSGWTGLLSLEPHLAHSEAVMATGPSGKAAMQDVDPVDAFLHGARIGKELLNSLTQ